jgi:hypothetical protein
LTAVRPLTPEERQRGRRAALKLAADELERLVAEIPPLEDFPGPVSTADYMAWRAKWNERLGRYKRVAAHMQEAHGARVTEGTQAARMTLRGVTCSCTGGLPQLLPNWIRKARAELERLG